jgi:hypothetical protein
MLTCQSSTLALRRITMILGMGSLVLCGLAAVSPSVAAKEKYTIDPVTGTKYKPEADMRELLLAFAALGGKPIETLTPTEARLQPTMADAVDALSKKRGGDTDPTKLVPDITTVEVTRKEYEGVTHEFFSAAAVLPAAKTAQSFAAEQLKDAFKE